MWPNEVHVTNDNVEKQDPTGFFQCNKYPQEKCDSRSDDKNEKERGKKHMATNFCRFLFIFLLLLHIDESTCKFIDQTNKLEKQKYIMIQQKKAQHFGLNIILTDFNISVSFLVNFFWIKILNLWVILQPIRRIPPNCDHISTNISQTNVILSIYIDGVIYNSALSPEKPYDIIFYGAKQQHVCNYLKTCFKHDVVCYWMKIMRTCTQDISSGFIGLSCERK